MLVFLSVFGHATADVPSDPVESAEWKKRILFNIDQDAQKPPDQAIPLLAGRIFGLSRPWNISPDSEDVSKYLKQRLIEIPGHAKYYQDKIEAMKLEVLANSTKTDDELNDMQSGEREVANEFSYSDYCAGTAFPTLGLIPSSESVAVLGYFLNDEEGRNGKNILGRDLELKGGNGAKLFVNAEGATRAIRGLGIEHPPFQMNELSKHGVIAEGEVDAWKDWWNEVKAGQRTYRFAGSPVEYGPDGPVSKDKLAEIQRGEKRNEDRLAGKRKSGGAAAVSGDQANKKFPFAIVSAGVVLLIAAGWFVLTRQKTKG